MYVRCVWHFGCNLKMILSMNQNREYPRVSSSHDTSYIRQSFCDFVAPEKNQLETEKNTGRKAAREGPGSTSAKYGIVGIWSALHVYSFGRRARRKDG